MTQAWNNLYEPDVNALPVTHLYVRFLPAGLEEMKTLQDLDIVLTTFPLDYEIVTPGDYYHDPTISEDQITWLYAVVEPDFQFPAVQYEVLEELVNAPFKSELTREAFQLVGENYGANDRDGDCDPFCENYPECLEQPELGCGEPAHNGSGGGWTPDPPCTPEDPDWPACLYLSGNTPGAVTNSCGCPVSSNRRHPGGCVKVVDTELPANSTLEDGTAVHLDGVKQAKIIWWNGWFGLWTTETDDEGCWQIQHEDHGIGMMWVRFKNDRAVIRGMRNTRIEEYSRAVTDFVGEIGGPYFDDIQVVYNVGGNSDSNSRLYWYAATGNNALWDFYQFAGADGIDVPPSGLDVLLLNQGGGAAAPMLNKTGLNWALYFGTSALLFSVFNVGIAPFNPILQALALYAATWAPDIIYNYDGGIQNSDRVKEVFYHEYAHAAHFAALNNNGYWNDNILYIANNFLTNNNSPYGGRGTPGYQRCAIIEMWGHHIGPFYADRKYETNHSLTSSNDPFTLEMSRWKYRLERFIPDVGGNPSADAWIPEGLFYDLYDDNALNPMGVADGILDPSVWGFEQSDFIHSISNGSPVLMSDVEATVNTFLPPGITSGMTRTIFSQYGY
jgi:hypothetical protein